MSNRRAFTLVEVTVAIAVTLVLTTLMLNVLNQSSVIWNRSNESLDTFREARGALQVMSREIGGLRSMPEPNKTFPLLSLQHHPNTEDEDKVNEEIYALVNTPNAGRANWCAVGYFCRWDAKHNSYSLVRQFTGSDDTFANMRVVFNATSPLTGPAAFQQLYDRDRINSQDVVATYCWDLHFDLPTGLELMDAQQGAFWPQGDFSQKLPPWIQVRCKVLGSLAARRLQNAGISKADWFKTDSDKYRRFILPYQQQFVTRISLAQ